MATAKRPKVVQTTKPSISSAGMNIETGGDMTRGVGSQRKGANFKHGATPGTKASKPGYCSGSMVDESARKMQPKQ